VLSGSPSLFLLPHQRCPGRLGKAVIKGDAMSTRFSTAWLLTLLVSVAVAVSTQAQVLQWGVDRFQDQPNLFLDFARFKSDKPDQIRLEVYYQVYNAGLQFDRDGDTWAAHYELGMTIKDDDGRVAADSTRRKEIRVTDLARTTSSYDYRSSQFNFDLPGGRYTVFARLKDLGSDKVVHHKLETKLDVFDSSKPSMSDVEFTQAVSEVTDSGDVFQKGNLQVVPAVTKAFGGSDDSRLLYYVEIYRGSDEDEKILVETKLRHATKGLIYRDTLYITFTGSVDRQLREMSLAEFPPGAYEMEVYLRGRRNKKLDSQRRDFEVLWSRDALVRTDWDKTLDQLGYVSEPGELDEFRKLESIEERKQAFDEFWRRRDPTVGTAENEAMREFYRRISVSNLRFSILRREGWRTDRGLIYIRYGEPDDIDDVPYAPNTVPYQVWHYYMAGRYKRFLFVDENEDGDYRLEYPYDGLYQTPDF